MSCRHCRGLHCDGCRDRGGSVAALAGLAVIIALAVPQVWPRIAHAVEIAAWTTAALTGTVITMTAGVWLTRISRRRRARRAAERTAVRRQAGPVISAGYQPGYRVIPGTIGGRPAISTPRRPARLYDSGCCERWTPEDGCPAHAGRPAMSLRARAGWPDRRGQR